MTLREWSPGRAFRWLPSLAIAVSAVLGAGTGTALAAASSAAASIAVGFHHACALAEDGRVLCWGANLSGQLGDGTTERRSRPTAVTGLPSRVAQISAGRRHTCAVTATGRALCWGFNGNGQLGTGDTLNSPTPIEVARLSTGVDQISAGVYSTCAVTTAGGANCWGGNRFGQLGDGSVTNRLVPTDVSGLTGGVSSIATYRVHTCAVTTSGGAMCWGRNQYGSLGDGTTNDRHIPVDVSGLSSGVVSIGVGEVSTCALMEWGGVKCWGSNGWGQLGIGLKADKYTPADVRGLTSGVVALSVGGAHACAITTDGALLCWGDNRYGDLGDGTRISRNKPRPVIGMSKGVVAVSAGAVSTCAVKANGAIYCWGLNDRSQFGDGTQKNSRFPVRVGRLSPH